MRPDGPGGIGLETRDGHNRPDSGTLARSSTSPFFRLSARSVLQGRGLARESIACFRDNRRGCNNGSAEPCWDRRNTLCRIARKPYSGYAVWTPENHLSSVIGRAADTVLPLLFDKRRSVSFQCLSPLPPCSRRRRCLTRCGSRPSKDRRCRSNPNRYPVGVGSSERK